MAVVAQLNVNLAAQTSQFSKGLTTARKDLRGLESQATRTQRTLAAFGTGLKGLNAFSGKLGFGGVLGGLAGGFTFANFAKDSLRLAAEDNKELKASLTELDATVVQIKKNFGGWLVEIGGANGLIQTFNQNLKNLSGGRIDERQALVNPGRLDTDQTAGQLRESIAERRRALAALEAQHDPKVANLELRKSWGLVNAEIEILERRLKSIQDQGLDFQGRLPNFEKFVSTEFNKGLELATPLFDKLGKAGLMALRTVQDGIDAADSGLQQLEATARNTMRGFQISQGNLSPLELFRRDTEELKTVFSKGALNEGDFNLALFDAKRDLQSALGINADAPSRTAGARRGTAEAFQKVAAFQDRTNSPTDERLDRLIKLGEEQVRLEREAARQMRAQFDSIGVVDTKP